MLDPALKSQAGPGDTDQSLVSASWAQCWPIPHHLCPSTLPPGLYIGVVRSMRGSRCSSVLYVLLQEDESRQDKVSEDAVQRQ